MARSNPGVKAIPQHGFAITPHNSDELQVTPCTVYIGGAGNLNVVTAGGESLLFTGVIKGAILPVQVRIVKSTSTTASLLIGLY